jgi:ParB-like chromosome segregation protein Spo0J
MKDLLKPVCNVRLVNIDKLKANDYNPNEVNKQNLELLKQSILNNGWTMPIVVLPDMTIIDGFHRWLVAQQPQIKKMLKGKIPVAVVNHKERSKAIYGTVTHNRARGTHQLEPMKKIIKELLDSGKNVNEISKQLGMTKEEVFRLSDFTREEFLKIMIGDKVEYSKARVILRI